MKQEDKELLLRDLCGRLPYYPKCEMIDELRVVNNEKESSYISTLFPKHIELFSYHNNFTTKPYLRPLDSMTEEEVTELAYKVFQQPDIDIVRRWVFEGKLHPSIDGNPVMVIDWFNARHFDYRGLIEKGLAIEAPEGMYK